MMWMVVLVLMAGPLPRSLAAPPGATAVLQKLGEGVSFGKTGQWVTYVLRGGPHREVFLRLAVVGAEKDTQGRNALWVELELGPHPAMEAPMAQVRLLCAQGRSLRGDGVTRAFFAVGAGKPLELQPEDISRIFASYSGTAPMHRVKPDPEVHARQGIPAALVTSAGTVRATPLEMYFRSTLIQRLWTSPEIPILGFAKWEIPAIEHVVEVQEFGTAAKGRMVLPDPKAPKIRLESRHE
jgi:hypothetical protein